MDNISQERFDSLMKLIREDVNSLTTADVEFLRARASYMDEEENAIMAPVFRNGGEGNLIAQAVSTYDKHIKDTNLAHPVSESQVLAATEDEKDLMAGEPDEAAIKRAHEAGVVNPEQYETRPELIEATIAAKNPQAEFEPVAEEAKVEKSEKTEKAEAKAEAKKESK